MMKFITVSRKTHAKDITIEPQLWYALKKECLNLIYSGYEIHDIKYSTVDASPYIQEMALVIAVRKSED